MGCVQAKDNRVGVSPLLAQDDSQKYAKLEDERKELARQFSQQASQQHISNINNQSASLVDGDQDLPAKIVRQDLSTLKQTLLPRNTVKIFTCRQLLEPVLVDACKANPQYAAKIITLIRMQTQVPSVEIGSLSSVAKDEVSFCQRMAREHFSFFKKQGSVVQLCRQIAQKFNYILKKEPQLVKIGQNFHKQSKRSRQETSEHWYVRFSFVLLHEIGQFEPVLAKFNKNDNQSVQSQKSTEMMAFYTCSLIVIRFLEGISWGYSPMLPHEELDKSTLVALKVTLNLLIRLRQIYHEDKILRSYLTQKPQMTTKSEGNQEDILKFSLQTSAVFIPEPLYQKVCSYNQFDRLIGVQSQKDLKQVVGYDEQYGIFLEKQVFRKTYVSAKIEIDEFMRMPSYQSDEQNNAKFDKNRSDYDDSEFLKQLQESSNQKKGNGQFNSDLLSDEISVDQLQGQHQMRSFTKDYLKQLKNPLYKTNGEKVRSDVEQQNMDKINNHNKKLYQMPDPLAFTQQKTGGSKSDPKSIHMINKKPDFQVENSRNIMLLTGAATDTRIITESFLQANFQPRSKYRCAVLHCCVRENKITQDAYYIVKNIMVHLIRSVPALKSLLLLQHHDYFAEILQSKSELNQQMRLQQDSPSILVKFFKILSQIKLDFNVGIFITGIENLFQLGDLKNFIYILRAASIYMPPYIRFVLTFEKRESKSTHLDHIIRLLATKTIFDVSDSKFFEQEGQSLVKFAYSLKLSNQNSEKKIKVEEGVSDDDDQSQSIDTQIQDEELMQQKLRSSALTASNKCYRNIVDFFVKMEQRNLSLNNSKEVLSFLTTYKSDHILLLPKIESLVKSDPTLTQVVLTILTQLHTPIGFNLLNRTCYAMTQMYARRKKLQRERVNSIQSVETIEQINNQSDIKKQKVEERTREEENHVENEKSPEKQSKLEEVESSGQNGHLSVEKSKKGENAKEERNEIERIFKQIIMEGAPPREFKIKLLKVLQSLVHFIFLIQKDSFTGGGIEPDNNTDKDNNKYATHTLNSTFSEEEEGGSDENNNEKSTLKQNGKAINDFDQLFAKAMKAAQNANEDKKRQIMNDMYEKVVLVPKKRKMLKACMSVLKIPNKKGAFDLLIQLISMHDLSGSLKFSRKCNVLPSKPNQKMTLEIPYENLDPYLRQNMFLHWTKVEHSRYRLTDFDALLSAENIFKQIVYFGSYDRFRHKLADILQRKRHPDTKEVKGVSFLLNTLHLIQQSLKDEPISFIDFCTQLRGRVIGDASTNDLPDFKFDEISKESNRAIGGYFENLHHALRENPRIDFFLQTPGCQILAVKFLSDKKRIIISLSIGLFILYNTELNRVLKIYVNKYALIDKVKVIDDRYLICAGIDPMTRIWNIDSQKQVSKFDLHPYCTTMMVCHKEYIFSYGYTQELSKFNFMQKTKECWIELSSQITALKLLKTDESNYPLKLVASFSDGDIVLYDLDLNSLCHTNRQQPDQVVRFISLSLNQMLAFYTDGTLSVLNNYVLEEEKQGSIFSLKSDDYLDILLIKSREYFLFTIEKQKIEFFNASTFKRSDSWDYFFERDIVGCDKNKEGSKICVWDKGGTLTLFNFLKHLENSKKEFNTPAHRRYDPVVCIDVTERLGKDKNQVISCSLERDLRIWNRDSGTFLKKYDLSSFTNENISTIKLGKSEGMLFLGSKDMNVYLIDITKGKLCVVYEGHWSRVTSIYTLPGKDILVTLSESNIKIWDLEYDECIKNMNDHSSLIVFCGISPKNGTLIITLSQSMEYKEWNYVTGEVVRQFQIDLDSAFDQLQAMSSAQDQTKAQDQTSETYQKSLQSDNQPKTTTEDFESKDAPVVEKRNLNLVACHISDSQIAYLASDDNKVVVYNLNTDQVLTIFDSYQNQTVIHIKAISTDTSDYIVVVTRTSCTLYSLDEDDGVRRLTSYLLNARKKPYRSKHINKFSHAIRFYFTTAKIVKVQDSDEDQDDLGNVNNLDHNLQGVDGYNEFEDLEGDQNLDGGEIFDSDHEIRQEMLQQPQTYQLSSALALDQRMLEAVDYLQDSYTPDMLFNQNFSDELLSGLDAKQRKSIQTNYFENMESFLMKQKQSMHGSQAGGISDQQSALMTPYLSIAKTYESNVEFQDGAIAQYQKQQNLQEDQEFKVGQMIHKENMNAKGSSLMNIVELEEGQNNFKDSNSPNQIVEESKDHLKDIEGYYLQQMPLDDIQNGPAYNSTKKEMSAKSYASFQRNQSLAIGETNLKAQQEQRQRQGGGAQSQLLGPYKRSASTLQQVGQPRYSQLFQQSSISDINDQLMRNADAYSAQNYYTYQPGGQERRQARKVKYQVFLGDSRGCVHMTNLYLV